MSENNNTVNLFPEDEEPGDFYSAGIEAFAKAPWNVVSKDGTLPEQLYNWKILNAYPGITAESEENKDDGKLKFVIEVEVTAPADYLGATKRENFNIGTDDDRMAQQSSTWATSRGASQLQRLCEHLGVAKETPHLLKGLQFASFTRNSKSPKNDQMYTNLLHDQYYKIGEVTPGTTTAPRPKNYRSRGAVKQSQPTQAIDPNQLIPCPICHQEYSQAVISAHVQGCQQKPLGEMMEA